MNAQRRGKRRSVAASWQGMVVAAASVAMLSGCMHRSSPRPAAPAGSPPAAAAAGGDHRYSQDRDSGPGGPLPDVSKIPEPVPRVEPRSVYGNKSPYDVLGHTYRVLPDSTGYVERGIASWYGNKFHGYTTSNFEKYDMYAYSAAHKTLPLPCYARVTNLENGASVIVRINDRGPFAENRIIDLSYVAAIKLGIWQKGTGLVEVRAIDGDHPDRGAPMVRSASAAASAASTPVATAAARNEVRSGPANLPEKAAKPVLYLQVGAYSDHGNAERAATTLRNARLGEVRIVDSTVNGKSIQRVRLGPLRDVDEADALAPKVRALGLGEPKAAIEE